MKNFPFWKLSILVIFYFCHCIGTDGNRSGVASTSDVGQKNEGMGMEPSDWKSCADKPGQYLLVWAFFERKSVCVPFFSYIGAWRRNVPNEWTILVFSGKRANGSFSPGQYLLCFVLHHRRSCGRFGEGFPHLSWMQKEPGVFLPFQISTGFPLRFIHTLSPLRHTSYVWGCKIECMSHSGAAISHNYILFDRTFFHYAKDRRLFCRNILDDMLPESPYPAHYCFCFHRRRLISILTGLPG